MDGLADGRVDGPTPVQAVQAYRQTDIIIPRVRFAQRRKEGKRKRYRVFRKILIFFIIHCNLSLAYISLLAKEMSQKKLLETQY